MAASPLGPWGEWVLCSNNCDDGDHCGLGQQACD
eukprot:gene39937-54706_t